MHRERAITAEAVKRVLRTYFGRYRAEPWRASAAFFFPAIGSVLVFFVPPLIVAQIVNLFTSGGMTSLAQAWPYVAAFAALWAAGEIAWRIGLHQLIRLEERSIDILMNDSFSRLMSRDYGFYTDRFVGSLTKMATAFTRGFETFTDTLTFNVVTNIFPLIFAVIVLWHYSPWIPLLLLGCILIAAAVGLPIIRKRSKLVAVRHEAGSRSAGRLSDALTNIFAVKSFAKEEEERRRFGPFVESYDTAFRKAADFQNLRFDMAISPVFVLTNTAGLAAAIFFAFTLGLPAGTLVVVFAYYSQITGIFWNMNRIYRNIESSVGEAAEFEQLFIEPTRINDAPGAAPLRTSGATASIAFEGVDFAYAAAAEGKEPFLKGFDLRIEKGQRVGLVGPSGGGKSTITKLLLRFDDPQAGRITIDGQDIGAVTQASVRRAISYVPQDPLLFHRSLADNIAYGADEASREDVIAAARLAHAHEFIEGLADGYDTLVGERGIKLSGGQRQRVAIARAMLKKSPILILDEATSSLDSESERYIQEGLWELMKDKTALVIAHRLSTIKHLDRIIVLDAGKIVQDGTHDELVARPGLYATLWSRQSGQFLEQS
ncbi:MAG: ABC transporter ATP-binding protein [Patescibacteria group bacterium]|nr:ABC transporter ATP-binding protein [Patescibacteria group bacterium]